MVDKVGPLKYEDSIDGTEDDFLPITADPSEDYLSVKGLSFGKRDDLLIDFQGDVVSILGPTASQDITYDGNGEVSVVEFYNGLTQTTPNRRMRVDVTYSGNDPASEVWKIYDPADGTTILRTFTVNYTVSGADITDAEQTIS